MSSGSNAGRNRLKRGDTMTRKHPHREVVGAGRQVRAADAEQQVRIPQPDEEGMAICGPGYAAGFDHGYAKGYGEGYASGYRRANSRWRVFQGLSPRGETASPENDGARSSGR